MNSARRTRIVCTLGPAFANEEALKELLHARMNTARLNLSHGNYPMGTACVIRSDGTIGSRKNVNTPGIRLDLPAMTEMDRDDIIFGIGEGGGLLSGQLCSHSSGRSNDQALLGDHGSAIRVIAKIEDKEGISNIHDITRLCDGVMVARGDLGIQFTMEQIPLAQKQVLALCNERNKPVITATPLLDSMIKNARPTRAELTDVANAIFDGTDALLPSGETAIGKHPVRSCATLDGICRSVEQSKEYRKSVLKRPRIGDRPAGEIENTGTIDNATTLYKDGR